MFGQEPLLSLTLPLHDRCDQHRSIVTSLLHFRKSEHGIRYTIGRCCSRRHQVIDIGMEQFVIERFNLGVGKLPEWTQRGPGSIKGERSIEYHLMLPGVILSGIAVQIVKLKLNETRWD